MVAVPSRSGRGSFATFTSSWEGMARNLYGLFGVAGFMMVGIIYLGYLYARNPQRITEVGLVHLDEPAVAQEASTSAEG